MKLFSIFFFLAALSQTTTFALTTTYVSSDDEEITVPNVVVTNGRDNVSAIYSSPLSDYLRSLINQDHFFETTESNNNIAFDLTEMRSQPNICSDVLKKLNAEGLFHLEISKGQQGMHLELALFTKKSGKIWAYADLIEKTKFDLDSLRYKTKGLYQRIIDQIPYQGLILSRTGNKVTINRGLNSGVKVDQDLDILQVLSVKRHPEFQFVTHVDKEIIGKVRLTKVEENISFGYILYEKEQQSIQPKLKVGFSEPVYYPNLATSHNEEVVDHLLARADGGVVLQGDSKEWLPQNSPTFGRAHFLFGMGQFGASTNLATSGSQQGSTLLALNAQIDSDFWITQSWFVKAGINQGSAQIKNPLSGSTPANLNFSLQGIKVALGYDLGVSQTVYGPRLQGLIGYSQFTATTTESSPTSYTSSVFSGLGFGLSGFFPFDEYESKWGFGGELWYHLYPTVSESPVTSGTGKNTKIVELSMTGYYHWRPNIYWVGKLGVDSFNTAFSGSGTRTNENATSTDFAWTRLNGGVEYLF